MAMVRTLLTLSLLLSINAFGANDSYTTPDYCAEYSVGIVSTNRCTKAGRENGLAAFPGAQGAGCSSTNTHGRGGSVIKVTNLNDSGAGSLRACTEATGARNCVFEVSGNIELVSPLFINSDVAIWGETAPSPGITVKNYTTFVKGADILIRHIRFAPGTDNPSDTRPSTAPYGDNYCNTNADPTSTSSLNANCPSYNGSRVPGTHPQGVAILIQGKQNYGGGSTSEADDICISHVEMMWGWQRAFTVADTTNYFSGSSLANNILERITIADSLVGPNLRDPPAPNDQYPGQGAYGTNTLIGSWVQDIDMLRNIIVGTWRLPLIEYGAKTLMVNNRHGYGFSQYNAAYQTSGASGSPNNDTTAIGNVLKQGSGVPDFYYRRQLSVSASSDYYGEDNLIPVGVSETDGNPTIVGSPLSSTSGITILPSDEVDAYLEDNVGMWPAARPPLSTALLNELFAATDYIPLDCTRSSQCAAAPSYTYETTTGTRTLTVVSDPTGDSDADGFTNFEEWVWENYSKAVE